MLKVLGLRKLPENQMKQEYELMLKDLAGWPIQAVLWLEWGTFISR
jgi:hypothetical protein